MKLSMNMSKIVTTLFAATLAAGVYAKGGGTAKPPNRAAGGPFSLIGLPIPARLNATTALTVNQFDDTGFIQSASVDNGMCPGQDSQAFGGKVKINNVNIIIPCNLIVQMPANTLTWPQFVNTQNGARNNIGLEMNVVGNIVDGKHIAALAYVSEEALNSSSGYISKINYAAGTMEVNTGDHTITVDINDPAGRFGKPSPASLDQRFSVDDENPTIHAATGYPMCVPRNDPNDPNDGPEDQLCPQKNRPVAFVNGANNCRNFSQAFVGLGRALPNSGELGAPVAGQAFCSQFVMNSVAAANANPALPDPRQQAPFEVGDYVTISGTFLNGNFMSAHTIEANVGIFTQPGTKPSYVAIGEFGVGTNDPIATAITGVPQENTNRIFLEAETTDVITPVDIFYVDVDSNGVEQNRWVSSFEMTGECNPAAALAASCLGLDGGITTQYTGPQPHRARIRAAKAINGMLTRPSRYIRVMARTVCQGQFTEASLTQAGFASTGHSAALDSCIANAPTYANGLAAGQYFAPVFEYIFPENVKPGDTVIANDLWQLPFLVNGEGVQNILDQDVRIGPLTPTPW